MELDKKEGAYLNSCFWVSRIIRDTIHCLIINIKREVLVLHTKKFTYVFQFLFGNQFSKGDTRITESISLIILENHT